MTSWVEALLNFLAKFWPFVLVNQWERGVPMLFGRVCRRWCFLAAPLPPGLFVYFPWFSEIETVSIVPNPVSTPMLDLTLSDGKSLSYSVTAIMQVFDPVLAITTVDDYRESMLELLGSKTSEILGEEDAVRMEHGKRRALIRKILTEVDRDTQVFGVATTALRFTNLVIDEPTIRVRSDSALSGLQW